MKKLFIIIAIIFTGSSIYSQGNIDGFGNIKWGSSINDIKSGIIGKITYTDEKKVVISRDGDIEYLYGFFYKSGETASPEPLKNPAANVENPDNKSKETGAAVKTGETENKTADSKLFYVSIRFPYLTKDEVKKKIEEKYGPSTGEDIKDNKGAIVWTSATTTIIMWVDDYLKKPYCMKINYLSKEIVKEVNNYQKFIFNIKEIEILKRLSL
ncbi:MAG: hypothetical protein V1874_05960 [Spirochaetota bacterium]